MDFLKNLFRRKSRLEKDIDKAMRKCEESEVTLRERIRTLDGQTNYHHNVIRAAHRSGHGAFQSVQMNRHYQAQLEEAHSKLQILLAAKSKLQAINLTRSTNVASSNIHPNGSKEDATAEEDADEAMKAEVAENKDKIFEIARFLSDLAEKELKEMELMAQFESLMMCEIEREREAARQKEKERKVSMKNAASASARSEGSPGARCSFFNRN